MTLPASGQISLSDINTEMGVSGTAQISLNDTNVRLLAGKPSGQIEMSDFYGKTFITLTAGLSGNHIGYSPAWAYNEGAVNKTGVGTLTLTLIEDYDDGISHYFQVWMNGHIAQNSFTSVTINGSTYLTSAATWGNYDIGANHNTAWQFGTKAGLANGSSYPVVFV